MNCIPISADKYLKHLKKIILHCLANRWIITNLETVSKMLGHNSIKTTQHYAKVLDGKISEDMQKLENRLYHAGEQCYKA
jgi:site-specific recombinase XerD